VISDPTPTGGQILEAACVKSPVEFVVYQLHTGGLLEELGVELTTDLRDAGIERFIVMRTDSPFVFCSTTMPASGSEAHLRLHVEENCRR